MTLFCKDRMLGSTAGRLPILPPLVCSSKQAQ